MAPPSEHPGPGSGSTTGAPAPRALLFDLGNVVIRIANANAIAWWARESGADPIELARRWQPSADYERHERGELTGPEFFASQQRMMGITLDDERFAAGWNAVFDGIIAQTQDVIAQARARGLPVYAFSNTNRTHRARFTALYPGEMARFERIFDSSEMGMRKPEPAAFAHVIDAIGVPAPTILFFDDLPENVAAGRAAGMQVVLVTEPDDVTRGWLAHGGGAAIP